ncbi:response regulator [Desulfovibrio sp. OttesenSCG-928-G15]|nr:response regulator [Desulfovibrio sp. OttesenSCG-928-G15]
MTALRVLIAEDEYISATLLEMLVKEEGHTVCGIVSQGGDVLEAVRENKPDVVLMDIHLADSVSGLQATRTLLQKVSVPVIVISGTTEVDILASVAESGALGFMRKPVTPEELRVNLRIATHHNSIIRKLSDSELLHRSIFDNASVGIYIAHKDGYYLATNRSFARMLGYSGPAELLRRIFSIDEQVYADKDHRASLVHQLKEGKVLHGVSSRMLTCDSEPFWVSEDLSPHYDDDGSFAYYEGFVVNISDKIQAQAEKAELGGQWDSLMQLLDNSGTSVAVTTLDGGIVRANSAFEKELGKAVGLRRMLRFKEDGQGIYDKLQERHAVSGAEAFVHNQCRVEGDDRLFDTTAGAWRSPEGDLAGAVFILRPL